MHIRLRDELKGDHVYTRIFVGASPESTLALAGALTLTYHEWRSFQITLFAGQNAEGVETSVDAPDALTVTTLFQEREDGSDAQPLGE